MLPANTHCHGMLQHNNATDAGQDIAFAMTFLP